MLSVVTNRSLRGGVAGGNGFTSFERAPGGNLGTTFQQVQLCRQICRNGNISKHMGKYKIAGKSQQRLEWEVAFMCLLHHSEKVTEHVDRTDLPDRLGCYENFQDGHR